MLLSDVVVVLEVVVLVGLLVCLLAKLKEVLMVIVEGVRLVKLFKMCCDELLLRGDLLVVSFLQFIDILLAYRFEVDKVLVLD